jgi:DNA topoisomerase-1
VGKHCFFLRGSRLVEKGWTTLYKPYAKFEDVLLPPLGVGQHLLVKDIRSEQKFTQAPARYNPGSLLRKMEESEIGTKATRADIIETLYRRGYVTGQRMSTTPLASHIIEIMTRYCPKVVDVAFTRELEAKMEQIELESETREHVVQETVNYLKPIIEDLKNREGEIGEELATIIAEIREESTTLVIPCPQCGSKLKIVRNPRTKKRFIGCSGKWKANCNFSLPLPQVGTLSLLQRLCPNCGFQLVRVRSRGRRPLVTCCRCYATKGKSISLGRQSGVNAYVKATADNKTRSK